MTSKSKQLKPLEGNIVSRMDAVKFNHVVIRNWKPMHQVWPFAYGDDILSAVSSLSAYHVTYHLRKALNVRPYARLTCYSPVMGMAGIATFLFQSEYVTARILAQNECSLCVALRSVAGQTFPLTGMAGIATFLFQSEYVTARILAQNECSLCVALRSVAGQVGFGSLYPLVIAPIICFYLADRLMSYPVPPLVRAPGEVLKLYWKLLAKSPRPFFVLAAANVVAAFAISLQKERLYADLLDKM